MQHSTEAFADDAATTSFCLTSGDHWRVARDLVRCFGIFAADVARRQQVKLLSERDFPAAATWGAVFHAVLALGDGVPPPREEIN